MARNAPPVRTNAVRIIAISVGVLTVTTWSGRADAAAACNPAPKPSAPAGSHWYYRIDHSTQRKCWYLAAQDQKPARVTPRVRRDSEPPSSVAMEQASETLPPAAELKPPDQDDRLAEQPGSRPPEVIPDAQSPGSPDTTQPELAKAPVQQAAGGVEVQKSTSSNQAA